MGRGEFFNRNVTRLLALIGCVALAAPASSSTSPLYWRGAQRLQVLCLVSTSAGVDHGATRDGLCRRVVAMAAAGSPVPVTALAAAGGEVLRPGAVTLLVHGSVTPSRAGRVMAFSIRPFRNGVDDPGVLFAAAPRAVLLDAPSAGPDLAGAVRLSLSETLPWLAASAGPRRIR